MTTIYLDDAVKDVLDKDKKSSYSEVLLDLDDEELHIGVLNILYDRQLCPCLGINYINPSEDGIEKALKYYLSLRFNIIH